MHIVLRDSSNGLYYASPDRWSKNGGEARVFTEFNEAFEFAWSNHMYGVEVVHQAPSSPEWDFTIAALHDLPPPGQSLVARQVV